MGVLIDLERHGLSIPRPTHQQGQFEIRSTGADQLVCERWLEEPLDEGRLTTHPIDRWTMIAAIDQEDTMALSKQRTSWLVFDSLSELRLLSQNPLRYRRQILALKRYFATRACTVVLLG